MKEKEICIKLSYKLVSKWEKKNKKSLYSLCDVDYMNIVSELSKEKKLIVFRV